jgi:hypothetical protein
MGFEKIEKCDKKSGEKTIIYFCEKCGQGFHSPKEHYLDSEKKKRCE